MCSGVLGYLAGSHPSRGAWIEIMNSTLHGGFGRSHPSRGAWIEIGTGATVTTPTSRRTPHGVRGLKFHVMVGVGRVPDGRTPHGVRGLKFDGDVLPVPSGAVAPLTGCVD